LIENQGVRVREGSVKNNETDILLLRRRVAVLEERFQGYCYNETPDTINIVTQSVFVDVPYTATLDPTTVGLESLTNLLGLRSVAKKKYLVRVQGTFDAKSLGANVEKAMRIVRNGTKIPGAQCHATGTANGVIAKLHSYAHFWMEPGDEVWMQAANFSSTSDIGFERGKMDIFRLAGVN
jgi:hypothetical protein